LEIGDGVLIEQGAHIVCQGSIIIEDHVAIAAYCTIVDTYHPHENPDDTVPIGARLPKEFSSVRIGRGTFIGVHCSILPNVRIGKKCVIGAGSVINQDIPDYSMVAGSPAKIISQYNKNIGKWI
jgi:acetyltransferase-like isoleucine patch superfamily enzyme